jgi:dTDP-4-amino-4,6-dideoxygalactose transaminase
VPQPSTKSRTLGAKLDCVPLLDLQRQYKQIREEVLAAIERVCASQHFILGSEVEALEREIAAFTDSEAAVGCASGTDALWLALAAAGVQPGDAVITTAFSFFASASAIVRAGARPVFADIDPRTLNLDPASVEAQLRSSSYKVKAILPVHLYGQCCNMDELQRLADAYKLVVIEDAAQAIGAAWHERKAGSLGVAAAFSFYPTKNLSAYGDAGLVTTRDQDLAEHMSRLRNHGSPRRYLHEEFGWNARMDAIQAAVLRVKLPHIEEWNRQRRERAGRYSQMLADAGLISTNGGPPIRPLELTPGAHHVFHQYVIRVERRDALRKFLTDLKIGTEIYYPIPLHLQPCFAYLGYEQGSLPESERAAGDVVALPMFPELTEDEQRWVVQAIAEFYG